MATEELSFKEVDLKFHFVLKDGIKDIENVSNDMNAAFASIVEYVDEENVVWMTEEDVITKGPSMNLTKKFIFVFESFDGRAFEYLKTKALLIGPRCMLSCLMEDVSIPLGTAPVFTTAMRGLTICPSGLTLAEKENLQNLVQWMGGCFSDDLNGRCTHLVSNTVKSNKYEKATLNNIIIMHRDWVHDVWARSKRENISATSKEFEKYKLPIFYGLYITTSGLGTAEKNELVKMITENGGHFTGLFKSSQTDILITEKNKTDSQKYQAAAKYKKDILIPDWIRDSVKKGYALPVEHYKIVALKVSTPTKMERSVSATDFNPDGTQLSEISRAESMRPNSTVNETIANTSVASSVRSAALKSSRPPYKDYLAQISTQQAKKSGPFLDGCCIYLAGFTADEKEKLNKILNVGGAIRFDEMNEKITHCIAGEPTQNELNKIGDHGIQVLTLEWLADSMKHKIPVQEDKYVYRAKVLSQRAPEPPSPSSKKTIESMNHSFKKPATPKSRLDFASGMPSTSVNGGEVDQFEEERNDFLSQYTPENAAPLPPKSTQPEASAGTAQEGDGFDSEMCTEDYENLNFFIGFTVHVHDHPEEVHQQLIDDCENAGAKLVDKKFKGIADFVIVPSENATDINTVKVKAKNTVNNLWIEEAIKENKIVEIKYYHEPIPITVEAQPLTGMVIVISVYANNERVYIDTLATLLGATKQDSYAKKNKPLLICPTAEGAKYSAAIKWNYPVVTSEWLVECANKGTKVSLEPYLVGDSVLSSSGTWSTTVSPSSSVSNDSRQANNTNKTAIHKPTIETPLEDEVFLPGKAPTSKAQKRPSKSTENLENIANNPVEQAKRTLNNDSEEKRDSASTPTGDNTVLQHRRLSELRVPGRRLSKGASPFSSPPTTPPPAGDLNISELVMEVSTPNRDYLKSVLKEMQAKETPESQRIRNLVATPGAATKTPPTPIIPESFTPEVRKRQMALWDSFYVPPPRQRKPRTPFSEIRKRFWKEALGDQYFEEGNYNTQTLSQMNDDAGSSTATTSRETQGLTESNSNVKRLSDFINNRDAEKQNRNDHHPLPEFETESAVHHIDTEMGGTEEMIGWRDPSEFTQGARGKVQQMKYKGTPRFSISCPNDALKEKMIQNIKQLKGEICENSINFRQACTHIVCERPNRGERILCGIASGKWILDLKYIENSAEAGYFLDEEQYEWGNPKATNVGKLNANEQLIANAAFRWRRKITSAPEQEGAGAFQGFRVILHAFKKEQFQNLISAGGGIVLSVKEPYTESPEALAATHCLVEQKKKLQPKDHKKLADAGVLVLSIMYLNAHLISDLQADYTKYLLSL